MSYIIADGIEEYDVSGIKILLKDGADLQWDDVQSVKTRKYLSGEIYLEIRYETKSFMDVKLVPKENIKDISLVFNKSEPSNRATVKDQL